MLLNYQFSCLERAKSIRNTIELCIDGLGTTIGLTGLYLSKIETFQFAICFERFMMNLASMETQPRILNQ